MMQILPATGKYEAGQVLSHPSLGQVSVVECHPVKNEGGRRFVYDVRAQDGLVYCVTEPQLSAKKAPAPAAAKDKKGKGSAAAEAEAEAASETTGDSEEPA